MVRSTNTEPKCSGVRARRAAETRLEEGIADEGARGNSGGRERGSSQQREREAGEFGESPWGAKISGPKSVPGPQRPRNYPRGGGANPDSPQSNSVRPGRSPSREEGAAGEEASSTLRGTVRRGILVGQRSTPRTCGGADPAQLSVQGGGVSGGVRGVPMTGTVRWRGLCE